MVKTTGANFGDFSPTVEPKLAAVPGVEAISPERTGNAKLRLVHCGPHRGRRRHHRPAAAASTSRAAACRRSSRGELMVEQQHRQLQRPEGRLAHPAATSPRPATQTLIVGGTYAASQLIGTNYLVSTGVFEANFTDQLDQVVMVKVAGHADPVAVRNGIDRAIAAYPNVDGAEPGHGGKRSGQPGQPAPHHHLRPAGSRHHHRRARHHQHPGPLGGRTDPGVRSPARRRHGPPPGAHHGPGRVGGHRPLRRRSWVFWSASASGWPSPRRSSAAQAGWCRSRSAAWSCSCILATVFGIVAAVWPARRAARTNVIAALASE